MCQASKKIKHFFSGKTLGSVESQLLVLTNRELETIHGLALLKTSDEIAEEMCVTHKSHYNYRNRIGDKLNLKGQKCLTKFVRVQKKQICAFYQHWLSVKSNL